MVGIAQQWLSHPGEVENPTVAKSMRLGISALPIWQSMPVDPWSTAGLQYTLETWRSKRWVQKENKNNRKLLPSMVFSLGTTRSNCSHFGCIFPRQLRQSDRHTGQLDTNNRSSQVPLGYVKVMIESTHHSLRNQQSDDIIWMPSCFK